MAKKTKTLIDWIGDSNLSKNKKDEKVAKSLMDAMDFSQLPKIYKKVATSYEMTHLSPERREKESASLKALSESPKEVRNWGEYKLSTEPPHFALKEGIAHGVFQSTRDSFEKNYDKEYHVGVFAILHSGQMKTYSDMVAEMEALEEIDQWSEEDKKWAKEQINKNHNLPCAVLEVLYPTLLDISLNGISLDEMKKELVEINQKDDSSWTKEEKKEFISDYIVTKLGLSLPDFHLWTNDIWKKIKMVPYSLWREDNDRKIVEENYKKINIIHAIMDQYF